MSVASPSLSIVIPLHRGGGSFMSCLDSVLACRPPADEVLVVIDGPGDEPAAELARQRGTRVIALERNVGPAAARNRGAAEASGELLFFLDADVQVPADLVGRVRQIFAGDLELAALIGSYDAHPRETNFLSQYRNLFHHYVHQHSPREGATFWGACGAVRRAIFAELGGFDESYRRPAIEDIELGYRLRGAGHRIALDPTLQVTHLKHWTATSMVRTDLFARAIPWTRLLLARGRLGGELNLGLEHRLSAAVVGAMILCMLLIPVWGGVGWLALLCGLVTVAIDHRLFGYMARQRGWLFALMTVPWHWFYDLCSAAGLGAGLVLHILTPRRRRIDPAAEG